MATVRRSDSTDTVALILELLFGLFGLLGMGWLYAGNLAMGAAAFFGYLVLLLLEGVAIALTGGLAACAAIPFNLALVVVSGFKARDHARNTAAQGSFVYVAFFLIVPVVVVCGSIFVLWLASPTIENLFDEIVRRVVVP